MSVEYIKNLGKNQTVENRKILLDMYKSDVSVEEKREIVSSIGRQGDVEFIYDFLTEEAFKKNYMDVIYQMFRTTLVYYNKEPRFKKLCEKMKSFYQNEVMDKILNKLEAKNIKIRS